MTFYSKYQEDDYYPPELASTTFSDVIDNGKHTVYEDCEEIEQVAQDVLRDLFSLLLRNSSFSYF